MTTVEHFEKTYRKCDWKMVKDYLIEEISIIKSTHSKKSIFYIDAKGNKAYFDVMIGFANDNRKIYYLNNQRVSQHKLRSLFSKLDTHWL